jgi:TolB protein
VGSPFAILAPMKSLPTGAVLLALAVGPQAPTQRDRIVFMCTRGGASNICTTDSSGSAIQQIISVTDTSTLIAAPRWSPHRDRIAFHQRTGSVIDVYTMDADGRNPHKVTNSDGSTLYRNPAWSPDGLRLAVDCGSQQVSDVCVITLDGSGVRKLTNASASGGNSQSPDWSPDGTHIAFQSNRDGVPFGARSFRSFDIYVMDTDGATVRRLTTTAPGRTSEGPAWSSDGQQILFDSTRDGESLVTDWQLYVMRPDGTGIQQLTHDTKPFAFGHPRWSPDSRSIVFHSLRDGTKGAASEVELYVIGADGMNLRRLTNNQEYDGFADWR